MAPLPAPAEKLSRRVSDSQSHAKLRPPAQVAVFCAALWPNLQPALTAALTEYIETVNEAPKPFRWHKTADEILASIKRFCLRTLETAAATAS